MLFVVSALLSALAVPPEVSTLYSAPGNPRAIRVAVINNAAPDGMSLKASQSKLVAGNYTSAPAATVPMYGGRAYNYGYAIAPDASGHIDSPVLYAAHHHVPVAPTLCDHLGVV